jgi:hypothetical protein
MSPGPLTSRQRDGYGFGPRFHGGGFGRIAPPYAGRDYGTRRAGLPGVRQRFSVDGHGRISLDPGESLVVAVDEDGAVTIGVGAPELGANGNGAGNGAPSANGKNFIGRLRRRMGVFAGNDGSITIEPEGDNTLQIVGSPEDGVVAVIELEPAPPVGPNGNGETGE